MLKLFHSIFGGNEKHGTYPESLIEMAIERAVDGTDTRLRTLPGYRKRLREAVIHAIDHVIAIVDGLPAPAASSEYASDPRLMAIFASADHMREVFGKSTALREFRKQQIDSGARVTTLLLAERAEKNILGTDLSGDMIRREVAQVAVNFHNHRLVDPGILEEEVRRMLKRRAFDHLLGLALLRITEVKGKRADLKQQYDLLRRKLKDLKQGGWNFDDADGDRPDPAALQAELDEIEKQFAELGADSETLNKHLDIVVDLLRNSEKHLWPDSVDLYLDRMNIQRSQNDASAHHIHLQELHNARGRSVVMLLVSLKYEDLPQRQKFSEMAERYLL